MNHRKYITAIILGLTASLLTSCNNGGNTSDTPAVVPEPIVVAPPPVVPEPTKEEQLATVEAEIKAMIRQAQCASSLDCRLLECMREAPPTDTGTLVLRKVIQPYSVLETDNGQLTDKINQRDLIMNQLLSAKYPAQQIPSTFCTTPEGMSSHYSIASCFKNQCIEEGVATIPEDPYLDLVLLIPNPVRSETINALIGDPVCSSSEQCGVWNVGYSSAECGETTTFAYSTFATDPKEIAEKVGQYAQSVAANYNAQGFNAVCQSNVSFTNGVCRNERCGAN
ncbi:hypothetical protein [Thiothrix subterranea]|uniref:Uncharacterized protein n=1 Tax=Thiothrix subterranea TaxID=2735563 RepID=A0AA51MTC4_9GAMM|nr:hypothetical protein [Thiothrix subterranea]MDQ5767041.1 hypothetical protein [Thiothrix subterranea]WML88097.1 hypothetical protein RCG00_06915 [Thiothrix subterranea]